jgi:hypothetical protein
VIVRRCAICTTPTVLAFLREAGRAMAARGVLVSRAKLAMKLSEVGQVRVHENTLRNHLLGKHDAEMPELPARG